MSTNFTSRKRRIDSRLLNLAFVALALALHSIAAHAIQVEAQKITQGELIRRTQALADRRRTDASLLRRPAVGKIDTARLDDFVGTYELAPGNALTISREADKLYSTRGTHAKALPQPESPDLSFRSGTEGRSLFR